MPPMLTDEDLNLPEVSMDSFSFSFQIPNSTLAKGDDLLADDNTFFEGANYQSILATPAPSSWTTTQSHSHAAPSTSRPAKLESSPTRHRTPTQLPSKPPAYSSGFAEPQQSPITEAPLLSKDTENSEVEIPREAQGVHQHQQEPTEPHFASITNSSNTLGDVLSPQSTFLRRSPLESHSEVGYSGPDLPPDDRRSSVDSGEPDRGVQGQLRRRTSEVPRKNQIKNRSTVDGGKLRSKKKAARTRRVTSASSSTSRTQHQPSTQGDKPLNPSTGDEFNRGLLSCASAEEAAGQLVMKSQVVTEQIDDKTECMDFERTTFNETEPNRGPEINTLTPGVGEIRGAIMNSGGQLDEPAIDPATKTTDFGNRDVDEDMEVGLAQLSPRKRSLRRYAAMERQYDGVTSTSPTLPVTGLASRSSRKRLVPATTPNRDNRGKKRKGEVTTKSEIAEELLAPVIFPAEAARPTVEGSSTLAASSDSTEAESSRSAGAVCVPDEILENEGVGVDERGEGVVEKELASAMVSSGGCGSNLGSGKSTSAKGPTKRLSGPGTRTRVRRSNRLSSSANVKKSLQGRSVSNSVSTRGDVLRASERERRFALVRTRQEARDKKKSGMMTKEQTDSAVGSSGSGAKYNALRRTRRTRPADSKSGSERRIETRRVFDQRTSRPATSLSNKAGDGGRGPIKPADSISSVKAENSQRGTSHTSRKENIRPVTIPQPFNWATDQRMEERKHFDDTVKEKEREKELLKEQREREREEEEEREIRELRKRAVPKANTVPEWYKDAPRKRKVSETIDSGSQ